MSCLQKCLNVFTLASLLINLGSPKEAGPVKSLWGRMADFTSERCNHWRLRPDVTIPALDQITVCLNLKILHKAEVPWTAFMYSHPVGLDAELGLGGTLGHLVVFLFGEKWTTARADLRLSKWSSVCLTWSQRKGRPVLYVDGEPMKLKAGTYSGPTVRRKIAPNGFLTLGAGHTVSGGDIVMAPSSGMVGSLSLFRMWRTELTEEQLRTMSCVEGNLLKWEMENWDTRTCAPMAESSLQCVWSFFDVNLEFEILCFDGMNPDLHVARDMAAKWLKNFLPCNVNQHRVLVADLVSLNTRDQVNTSHDIQQRFEESPISREFICWVTLEVVPGEDVAAVQAGVQMNLSLSYSEKHVTLKPRGDSIRTTPVEGFPTVTVSPPTQPITFTAPTFAPTPTSVSPTPGINTTSPTPGTGSVQISDLYFEIRINVTLTGSVNTMESITTWLNNSLPKDQMVVVGVELSSKNKRQHSTMESDNTGSRKVLTDRVSREECVFQLQAVMSLSTPEEMEEQIRRLLMAPYNNGSVSIVTEEVEISRIWIVKCPAESHQTRRGLFEWPETLGGRTVTQKCPKNSSSKATRQCKLCVSTHWMDPDLDDCTRVIETILDLDRIDVTFDNAPEVLDIIEDLLNDHSDLNFHELDTIFSKLQDIIECSAVSLNLGQGLIDVISEILKSDSNLEPFTNTILNLTESLGDRMVVTNGASTLLAPAIAISVVDVVPEEFESLTFGVSSDQMGSNLKVYINSSPYNGTVAFVSVPSDLKHSFPPRDLDSISPRVQFQFHGLPVLFGNNPDGLVLNTFVVSASVTNASAPVKDLSEKVKVTLRHLKPNTLQKEVHCVYWDFAKNNGRGGWDGHGCQKFNSTSDSTTCLCDHLTHFGVLLDVSRTPLDPLNEWILTIITYVGCGVSSVFLGITVLTYTVFEKLRRDYPSQILINLSLALLALNLVFLVNSWVSSWEVSGLCVAVASLLHYFLLASFTWMGLEAINMYFALVKVFNAYVPSYILKFCLLGWGIPLLICILVLIVNRDAYGSQVHPGGLSVMQLDHSAHFCWLQDDLTFYVSVVAYSLVICLFNIGVFIVVLNQIRQMRANSPAGSQSGLMQDLKGVASLTLLLGLTWTVGFFTWGPARVVLLYLFALLNTLQGLFIFLFHCLKKENVRRQWRIHLCFGRFQLDEYSEWSNSVSAGVQAKPMTSPPKPLRRSVHSIKSSSTESTSASSSSSSHRESSSIRPDLGLFVNTMNLPGAQRHPSVTGALTTRKEVTSTPGLRSQFLDPDDWRCNHPMTTFAHPHRQRNKH